MILDCSWKNRKNSFSVLHIWMIVLMAVAKPVPSLLLALHPSSSICTNQTTVLLCQVTDNEEYQLGNFQWEGFREVIIKNATRLFLKEPLCSSWTKKVKVYNADQVITEPGEKNCSQQLELFNSRHVTIEDGVNLLQMFSSEARKIILPLGSFHLKDTQVGEANLTVDSGISTMTNSTTVKVVKGLVVKDLAVLNIESTSLGKVEGFFYDSEKNAQFINVTMDFVASHGIRVVRGILTLDNVFIKSIAPLGFLVVQGAKLILQHCVIETTVYESILVSDGGIIIFENMTIGQVRNVSFSLSGVFGQLYPLAFLKNQSISILGWIAIAVFSGAMVGTAVGFILMIVMQRYFKASRFKTDTTKHIEQTTAQTAVSANAYKHMGQSTPTLSKAEKTDTEQQVDVMKGPPIELAPRAPTSQRPRLPLPHESSALTVIPQNLLKPIKATINKKDMDERDVLPLPPPPPLPIQDEELYDDVQVATSTGGK